MVKVFAFLKKKDGMDRAAFIDYYENHHVPLICSLVDPPPVYKRNYLKRGDDLLGLESAAIAFDVVTEQVFPDAAAFEAWVGELSGPGNGQRVRDDEDRFLDRSHYFAYVVEERATTG